MLLRGDSRDFNLDRAVGFIDEPRLAVQSRLSRPFQLALPTEFLDESQDASLSQPPAHAHPLSGAKRYRHERVWSGLSLAVPALGQEVVRLRKVLLHPATDLIGRDHNGAGRDDDAAASGGQRSLRCANSTHTDGHGIQAERFAKAQPGVTLRACTFIGYHSVTQFYTLCAYSVCQKKVAGPADDLHFF